MYRVLILLLAILCGCSSSIKELNSSWTRAKYYEAPGVVSITTAWGKSHLCTGVLVHPRAAITAAHCLGFPPEDIYVTYGCDDVTNRKCIRAKIIGFKVEDGWRVDYVSSDDLGLVITEKPIIGIQVAQIYNGPYKPGISIMQAGFGQRNGASGILYGYMGRLSKDYTYEFVAGRSGALDPHPGDSGGPAFIMDKEDGLIKLAGVLSRGRMRDTGYTGFAIYTKPGEYIDWIEQVTSNY